MDNVKSKKLFTENTIKEIKNEIETASGNEIFLIGNIDLKSEMVTDFNVLARGNSNMVPAILSDLRPGQVIIHNHPSDDLRPSGADIRIASKMGEKGIGFAIIDNQVKNIYVVVEPRLPIKEKYLDSEKITSLFARNGKLSNHFPDYEYRKQQIEVVNEVICNFNKHQISFIEAGTGTGKSFAYLIPALYWTNLNQQPVVISTNTINLQEQLIEKDLVFLKKILPFSFKSVLVKGRSNYLCKRKLRNLQTIAGEIFEDQPEKETKLKKILNWADNTKTGTRSDIKFLIKSELWEKIASESELCLKTNCPHFSSCYFMKARKEIYSADLLIVNHHLLLSDANLKREHDGILPDYKHLIVDEAHNFNEIATHHLGNPFYYQALNKFLRRLDNSSLSLIPRLRNQLTNMNIDNRRDYLNIIDKKIFPQIKQIEDISKDYFKKLEEFYGKEKEYMLRLTSEFINSKNWEKIKMSGQKLSGFLANLGLSFNKLYERLITLPATKITKIEERIMELESAINNCQQLIKNLEFNLEANKEKFVFWLEKENKFNKVQISQKNAPLNISTLLPEILWDKLDNIILTSATLSVNNSFNFFKESLGLKKSRQLQIKTPFNYQEQACLLIPKDIPPANSPVFLEKVNNYLGELLLSYGSSTMVLFTSYKMLNYCVKKTEKKLNHAGINLLPQGRFPRNYILKTFKNNNSQIIFGTVSFWEGVDIKGDNLKYLIIMKLPFPVPSRPVASARRELLKKEGKNPFLNYSLPRAVIRFKQGFGRLIRSRHDKGIIVSFDNRLSTKSYGKVFLNSLPKECPVKETKIKSILKQDN